MKKRGITFLLAGILAIGTVGGFAYANTKDNVPEGINQPVIEKIIEEKDDNSYNNMIESMKKIGLENIATYMENRDYKAIDEFMNNITDEEYKMMIKSMRDSGNENMANMMESMDKDTMVKMHNAMGGAQECHVR